MLKDSDSVHQFWKWGLTLFSKTKKLGKRKNGGICLGNIISLGQQAMVVATKLQFKQLFPRFFVCATKKRKYWSARQKRGHFFTSMHLSRWSFRDMPWAKISFQVFVAFSEQRLFFGIHIIFFTFFVRPWKYLAFRAFLRIHRSVERWSRIRARHTKPPFILF